MRRVLADDDAHGTGGAAGGKPVSPTHNEAGKIADGTARKIVLAPAFGNRRAQFRQLKGADQGVERSANPHTEEKPMIGEPRGNIARRADDPRGNGIANGDRNAEADTQNLEKFSFFLAFGRPGRVRRGEIRGRRQGVVSWRDLDTRHHTFVARKCKEIRQRQKLRELTDFRICRNFVDGEFKG
jgi:hypothetical protein